MSMIETTDRLLNARDAAEWLAVSERTLWAITMPRGSLTCVRIGRSVRYAPSDLRKYVEDAREVVDGQSTPGQTADGSGESRVDQ